MFGEKPQHHNTQFLGSILPESIQPLNRDTVSDYAFRSDPGRIAGNENIDVFG